jgi:hypothetical protein
MLFRIFRVLFFTVVIVSSNLIHAADSYYKKSQITRKMFAAATAATNKNTPTMTDSETWLMNVTGDYAQGLTTYHLKMVRFKLSDFSSSDLREFQVNFTRLMIQRNCSTPDIVWKFNQGFSNQYVVRGTDDRFLASVMISKTVCESPRR